HVRGQKVVETEIGFLLMSMNLTKLAKKLVQESRNRKKNTDSSAGFHLKQLNLSVYFFSYWLVFAQPLFDYAQSDFFKGIMSAFLFIVLVVTAI
ncbi:TPA: hypothetical protein ACGOY7_002025, partial [Streptococcus suis]